MNHASFPQKHWFGLRFRFKTLKWIITRASLGLGVVAPSHPGKLQSRACSIWLVRVVAPSLTPESYNITGTPPSRRWVVAPSLTPESYNASKPTQHQLTVVAPSLTPESYNQRQDF